MLLTAPRSPLVALFVVALVTGLWLAADGRHHWDEPSYLYAGAYLDAGDIIGGRVQPSGIANFTQGRILHALFVKGVMKAAGRRPAGFIAISCSTSCCSSRASCSSTDPARPAARPRPSGEAAAFVAMSPVILYLVFQVLADTEALFAALVATYALLGLARGGGISGVRRSPPQASSFCALTKNQMVFMPATFWATLSIVPACRY